MAYINKGNTLTTPLLQPGYKVRDDGYGLWTGSCTFLLDKSMTGASLPASLQRGAAHPDATYSAFMFANNVEITHGRNSICSVDVTYVGISSDGYAPGTTTNPNTSGAVTTTSEPIETHRNFFEAITSAGGPIAGVGTGTVTAPIYEASTFKAKVGDSTTLYKGDNGAHFTQKGGGQFVGFLDPQYPMYYGRKSYLAPVTGFSGVIYTNDAAVVVDMRKAVGRASSDNDWNGNLPKLIPDYQGTTWLSDTGTALTGYPQLLLASVNAEDFGLDTYKVSYTIKYNDEGYVEPVYPAL